ncbi:MAG: carboxypeptidase-like regulatory domain-containing protein [Bryobacteraceae bacterium]|nr:carboxypeptidase-like regulatory domain-containing protein [Bryobacteraceae bacterium]
MKKLVFLVVMSLPVNPRFLAEQGLTGQISGIVADASGVFVVTDLLSGTYSLEVVRAGFRKHEQTEIALSANERVALRRIVLEIGELTQTVRVTADQPQIQTQSGERGGLISSAEIQELGLKGRDYMELLALLPASSIPRTARRRVGIISLESSLREWTPSPK